jgi:hypothetical protein
MSEIEWTNPSIEHRVQLRLPGLLAKPTSADLHETLEEISSSDPALGLRLENDPQVVERGRALFQGESKRTRNVLDALNWLDGAGTRPGSTGR